MRADDLWKGPGVQDRGGFYPASIITIAHLMPRTKLGKSLPQSASRDAGSQQDALGACPSCDVNCVRTSGIGPVVAFLCGR